MHKVLPYIIKHIQLADAGYASSLLPDNSGRHYCVFWWQSIAIGDIYIEHYNGNYTELKQAIFSAIEPAIVVPDLSASIKQAFLNNEYSVFFNLMDEAFALCLPDTLPTSVDISVVICTRNRSEDLKLCLDSLLKQTCLPKEIIVVDNAPSDNSTKKIAEQYHMVTYCCELKPGLDFARNTGARKAGYPIIAYVDDDVKVHIDWCYRVWETFNDDNVAAMTGLIIALSLQTESQQIFEKHWGFNKGYKDITFNQDFIRNKPPRVWDIGAGANMAFRKQVLDEMNYFDERLGAGASGCGDDSEMWYRILLKGYTIKYNPRAISFHEHRKQLSSLHKQLFSYMRGHAAAALLQHDENPDSGYKKYIFYDTPKYYLLLARIGFPDYNFRYRTLWSEIKGIISGISFYYKNRKNPRITKP